MPYAQEHMYFTVKGTAMTGNETWQFGFRMTDGGVSTEQSALAAAPIIESWWRGTLVDAGGTGAYAYQFAAPDNYTLTELKCARIQTDGLYDPAADSYSHFYIPAIAGTATGFAMKPAQSATAVTLLTAKPRGLASHGRIYLPLNTAIAILTDGRTPVAEAQRVANNMGALIRRLNGATLLGNVAIFSRGKGVGTYDATKKKIVYTYPNPGVTENVTHVSVGRVTDTQRRRRRSLLEDRQGATV